MEGPGDGDGQTDGVAWWRPTREYTAFDAVRGVDARTPSRAVRFHMSTHALRFSLHARVGRCRNTRNHELQQRSNDPADALAARG